MRRAKYECFVVSSCLSFQVRRSGTFWIIINIIIIVFVITFVQGIYSFIRETFPVSRDVHTVATVLYLQFVPQVVLFRTWNMLCTLTLVFSEVCVQCPIWLFFSPPWFRASLICCSGIVRVILRWFQLLLFYYYYYYYYYVIIITAVLTSEGTTGEWRLFPYSYLRRPVLNLGLRMAFPTSWDGFLN